MKNIKYFLLSFLIIVLFPKYSFAQMILSNSLSFERMISNTAISRVMPVKTENWDDNHIISLVHYESNKYTNGRFITQGDILYHKDICTSSVFYITEVNTNIVKMVTISGHTITDFCIVNDYIFMCGQDSANNNFVANENIDTIFNLANNSSLSLYHLNNILYPVNNILIDYTLTSIDFCFSTGLPTLLLLANRDSDLDSYFISYNLFNNNFAMYKSNARSLDVVHTNNYIAVLGMDSDTTFTITRYEINNVSNHIGRKFTTNPLYVHFLNPKYHLTTLLKNANHIVVGESVMNTGWMEFNVIDLNNLSILSTQATIDTRESRSKIKDLEFNEQQGVLYCLFCNGFSIRDMILGLLPYNTQNQNYSAFVSKPITYRSGYTLSRDIALYGDNSQLLVLGRMPTLNIYLFDRIFNLNVSGACDEIDSLTIGSIESPNVSFFDCSYYDTKVAHLQQISIYKDTTNYNIICP
jgi:hypothetical protein